LLVFSYFMLNLNVVLFCDNVNLKFIFCKLTQGNGEPNINSPV